MINSQAAVAAANRPAPRAGVPPSSAASAFSFASVVLKTAAMLTRARRVSRIRAPRAESFKEGHSMDGGDYPTSTQGEGRCPRCGEGTLKAWYELSEDEREVARRLPDSADFTLDARAARHRFCTRCWYEQRTPAPRNA